MYVRPAVAGELVLVGSCSGALVALERATGRDVWSYDTALDGGPENFHGNLRIAGDRVIVGTDGVDQGKLYAFDRDTGEVRWSQATTGGFPSDVLLSDARVFAVTMSGEVRSVELDSGRVVWTAAGEDGARYLKSSIRQVGANALAVSLPSGEVRLLDRGSGATRWTTRIDARLNTTLERIGDALYVGDVSGKIHRLALSDGSILGRMDGTAPAYGALIAADDCLLALWAENTLACVDPELGSIRWSRETDSTWSTFEPLLVGRSVLVGTASGEVHAIDRESGETTSVLRLEGEIKSLALVDGVLYVGTLQGTVSAVRVGDSFP